MSYVKPYISFVLLALGMLASASSVAGISLSSTRVIFPGNEREVTPTVMAGDSEVVFQSWLDIDENPDLDLPFTVTPSLAKLNAGQAQILRILYQGTPLPADRESLFWLNVQEIPKVSTDFAEGKASGLSFTVRQRVKMFFRPEAVKSEPIETTRKLNVTMKASRKDILIENTGPNFITLVGFSSNEKNTDEAALLDAVMIPPFSKKEAALSRAIAVPGKLYFQSINDFGFTKRFAVDLAIDRAVNPDGIRDDVK